MIRELLVLAGTVFISSTSMFWGILQCYIYRRDALERRLSQERAEITAHVEHKVHDAFSTCRDFAPDNTIRCNLRTGHTGLHTDGKRWWYGNAWFPTQLEVVEP